MSTASFNSELRQFNFEFQLATTPRLLTSTVALLLFLSEYITFSPLRLTQD